MSVTRIYPDNSIFTTSNATVDGYNGLTIDTVPAGLLQIGPTSNEVQLGNPSGGFTFIQNSLTIGYYNFTGSQFQVNGATAGGVTEIVGLAQDASSGSQLQNSPRLTLRGKYWNGSSSVAQDGYIQHITDSTSPTSHLSFQFGATGSTVEVAKFDNSGTLTLTQPGTSLSFANSATSYIKSNGHTPFYFSNGDAWVGDPAGNFVVTINDHIVFNGPIRSDFYSEQNNNGHGWDIGTVNTPWYDGYFSNSLIPQYDNTGSIGQSSTRWRDGYFGGTITTTNATVDGYLQQLSGQVSLTANTTSQFTTTSGDLTIGALSGSSTLNLRAPTGTINVGTTTATAINIGNVAGPANITLYGDVNTKSHSGYAGSQLNIQTAAVQTTNATATTVYTLALANTTYSLRSICVARDEAGVEHATIGRVACFYREAGGAVQQGSTNPWFNDIHSNPGMDLVYTISGNNVLVQVDGIASTTIDWVVTIEYQAVSTTA